MKTGHTLKELNVKPGDKVKVIDCGSEGFINKDMIWVNEKDPKDKQTVKDSCMEIWEIVSRASEDKFWQDLSREEKGALLLAYHEGKIIEWSYSLPWVTACDSSTHTPDSGPYSPAWCPSTAYRIKKEEKSFLPLKQGKFYKTDDTTEGSFCFSIQDDVAWLTIDNKIAKSYDVNTGHALDYSSNIIGEFNL